MKAQARRLAAEVKQLQSRVGELQVTIATIAKQRDEANAKVTLYRQQLTATAGYAATGARRGVAPTGGTVICDTCGAPATWLARDVERTGAVDGWMTYRSRGGLKCGCNAHPVYAHEYDEHGTLVGRLTDDAGRPIPLGLEETSAIVDGS